MELQSANKYTKIYTEDFDEGIENMKKSIQAYERARNYINDYKKFKKFTSDEQMGEDLCTQANICDEMIKLMPEKIMRLTQ